MSPVYTVTPPNRRMQRRRSRWWHYAGQPTAAPDARSLAAERSTGLTKNLIETVERSGEFLLGSATDSGAESRSLSMVRATLVLGMAV